MMQVVKNISTFQVDYEKQNAVLLHISDNPSICISGIQYGDSIRILWCGILRFATFPKNKMCRVQSVMAKQMDLSMDLFTIKTPK